MPNLCRTAGDVQRVLARTRQNECAAQIPESGGLLPAVAVMETAQAWERNYLRSRTWPVLHGAPVRSVLAQAIVNPVRVIIANEISDQPSYVPFVE
jgi:hypothetical protein